MTTNTVANIGLRVPVEGVPPDALALVESEGGSWYNGLETSLTKRLSKGLQFLASYTFSKTLDSDHDQLGVERIFPHSPRHPRGIVGAPDHLAPE